MERFSERNPPTPAPHRTVPYRTVVCESWVESWWSTGRRLARGWILLSMCRPLYVQYLPYEVPRLLPTWGDFNLLQVERRNRVVVGGLFNGGLVQDSTSERSICLSVPYGVRAWRRAKGWDAEV